jgi:hypothetical protein
MMSVKSVELTVETDEVVLQQTGPASFRDSVQNKLGHDTNAQVGGRNNAGTASCEETRLNSQN